MATPKGITVAQLVGLLAKQDQAAVVWVEGCDCVEPACGISRWDDGTVVIRQERGMEGPIEITRP
jgi:hypothetical protein